MKYRILIIGLLSCLSLSLFSQNKLDDFFDQYRDDDSFTMVNISPKMFQMIARLDLDEDEDEIVKTLANTISGLRILIREDGDGRDLFKDAFSQINDGDFDELLTVRDKGEDIRFMVREGSDNTIQNLVLLVGGSDQFVLLDISGNIDLKTIGKLGNAIDIPGVEHLNKLGDN